jgi:hypothetical protein
VSYRRRGRWIPCGPEYWTERAQLIARTAFTAAKHLAGLHAAYMHLFSAPQNYARSELLHDIGDKFTLFLIGIPEDDVFVQREVSIQVGDVFITANPAQTSKPDVPDVPEVLRKS